MTTSLYFSILLMILQSSIISPLYYFYSQSKETWFILLLLTNKLLYTSSHPWSLLLCSFSFSRNEDLKCTLRKIQEVAPEMPMMFRLCFQ